MDTQINTWQVISFYFVCASWKKAGTNHIAAFLNIKRNVLVLLQFRPYV